MSVSTDIITYNKGSQKTRDLVPTLKTPLAFGTNGTLYPLKNDLKYVVKKSIKSLEDEFQIGQRGFTFCCKAVNLYIKNVDSEKKYKLVMEKIEGDLLDTLYEQNSQCDNELILNLLQQAINNMLTLYKAKVCWEDIHGGNIFLVQGSQLKFCDLEWTDCSIAARWNENDPESYCAKYLMIGLQNTFRAILKISSLSQVNLRSSPMKNTMSRFKQAQDKEKFIQNYGHAVICQIQKLFDKNS